MAVGKGSAFLLSDTSGTPTVIANCMAHSVTFGYSHADVTSKSSGGEREILPSAGIATCDIAFNGVFSSTDEQNSLITRVKSGAESSYSLAFEDGSTVTGNFVVASFESGGETEGGQTFSATLNSSGAITHTPV